MSKVVAARGEALWSHSQKDTSPVLTNNPKDQGTDVQELILPSSNN